MILKKFNLILNHSALYLIGFLLLAPWAGLKPFFSRGEGREALVAQSMYLQHDYILPTSYDGVVPSKPPLIHWLSNLLASLFGDMNEWAARLPSALLAVLFLIVFTRWVRTHTKNSDLSLLSGIILLFSPEWFRAAAEIRVDMALMFFMCLGVYSLYDASAAKESPDGGRLKQYAIATLFFIGATLAKGPIGVALPMALFGVFLLCSKKLSLRALLPLVALIFVTLAGAGVWYLLAWQYRGDLFLSKVLYENVARLTSTMEDAPHKHSAFYLVGMLLLGMLPWSLVFISRFFTFLQTTPKLHLKENYQKLTRDPFILFHTIFAIGVFIFFCIPSSKRGAYLLPAYPSLTFLAAFLILKKYPDFLNRRFTKILFSLLFAIYLGGQIASVVYARKVGYQNFSHEIAELVREDQRLYSFQDEFYGVSFYLKKPFFSLGRTDDREKERLELPSQFKVILFRHNLEKLRQTYGESFSIESIKESLEPMLSKKNYPVLVELRRR